MLRFIVKQTVTNEQPESWKDEHFRTVDIDVPQLEETLRRGGYGPNGAEIWNLVGVELRDEVSENDV